MVTRTNAFPWLDLAQWQAESTFIMKRIDPQRPEALMGS